MLKLRQISIFGGVRDYLADQQTLIDNLPGYADKVKAADLAWRKKNRAIFRGVREVLDTICPGSRRCHYCEDSAADEIEHVWPKKFYPEMTFIWQNYLFACGPCNGSNKNDKFAIFDINGLQVDVVRGRNDAVVQPPVGDPLFINPTIEEPTDYISLDLETGLFVPLFPRNSREFKRAEYTISVLGLNARDYLSRARRNAYAAYKDALNVYVELKNRGATQAELLKKREEISEKHHPTVWHEMKVTASQGIAHQVEFGQAPELYQL